MPIINRPLQIKVLLHCAIFSATCLAMVGNVALQVAEVWCWCPVTLCNFLSNLSRNAPRNEKRWVCTYAIVKTAVKLRDKLLEVLEGSGVVNYYNPLRKVELCSTSCNASRNKKIAREPMLHCAILQQLVSQRNCETSCWKKLQQGRVRRESYIIVVCRFVCRWATLSLWLWPFL